MGTPPAGYPISAYSPELQPKEHASTLYAHHIDEGTPLENTRKIGGSGNWLVNWTMYDGPKPDAKLVGRLQGLYYSSGNSSVDLVFTDGRFPSTLKFAGYMENGSEMAIVGGTGIFAMAHGIVKHVVFQPSGPRIREFKVHAMVPTLGKNVPVTKEGPWGSLDSGREYELTELPLPLDLESVTIESGDVVDSLAFSYISQDGNKHKIGPWGLGGGTKETIQLDPMETVTNMTGSTGEYQGNTVLTSISFATNMMRTYGPYGIETANKFSTPAGGNIIVGFYARAGPHVNSIGVYVRKN